MENSRTASAFVFAFQALFFIGGVQWIMAVLMLISAKEMSVVASLIYAAVGGVLIGLGLLARNSGRKAPFLIGIILCAGNLVFMAITGVGGGIFATIILLFFLIRGMQSKPYRPDRKDYLDEDAPLDSDI